MVDKERERVRGEGGKDLELNKLSGGTDRCIGVSGLVPFPVSQVGLWYKPLYIYIIILIANIAGHY